MIKRRNIFYTGGCNKRRNFQFAWEIYGDTYTSIKNHALMIEARSGHAICNFKNVIYVFGGNSSNDMRSAEKFDFCQTWELIAPLNQGKHKASCIIQKDHIYIAGNYSADIDIYHPETNSYEVISSVLSHLKFSPQMINVSDQLYILHWTDFLRINCDRSKCEQLLTNLPRTRLLDWWS